MNGNDLRGRYAEHLWSWDWLGKPIGVHPAIRPGDSDGWIHQGGEMLMLEGKVTESRSEDISAPQHNAVRMTGNLTIVLLHTDHAHWVDNRPTRVQGYRVYPSRAFPWEGGARYVRLPVEMRDEDTLCTGRNLIVGWSWWAGT
ncbi:MAG: hypothetical protein ABWZ55_10245, partial [Acidimicrobiales bacterium]